MKRALIVLAVLVVALACCAPAFASSGVVAENHIPWWTPAHTFTAVGKAQAVDTTNGRLVVRVTLASAGVAAYLGDDLTVVVTPKTQILRHSGRLYRTISLGAVRLGDNVRVTGAIDLSVPAKPVFTAKRVIATHVVRPDQIKWFAFRGPVRSVDATGGTLVAKPVRVTRGLWDVVGVKTTFVVAPKARIFTWVAGKPVVLTLADVTAGEHVLAQGSINRSVSTTPVFTIKWMRVWVPAPKPARSSPCARTHSRRRGGARSNEPRPRRRSSCP